jgi:uroporphyrin-III C-methyltransferase/precorrin-2 dehydrogenase/sirohydrochlorin ferrochelatase
MGLKNLPAITATLLAHGRPPTTPAAIVVDGATDRQHVVRSDLAGLPAAAADLQPPALVVIGDVVGVLAATGG